MKLKKYASILKKSKKNAENLYFNDDKEDKISNINYILQNMGKKMKPEYTRIMLKLSGEGLSGEKGFGIDSETVSELAKEISDIRKKGVQIALVVGGGNFFRGAKNACDKMDRSVADNIGMMVTVINALALKSAIEAEQAPCKIFSGISVPSVCNDFNFEEALQSLKAGNIVIFAGGTGNPYFTTDTGAALRAAQMHCQIMMKATQVDGVYDSDPRQNPNAQRFDTITYNEIMEKHLSVIDMTAASLLRDNNIPTMIFLQKGKNSISDAICGNAKRTIIK